MYRAILLSAVAAVAFVFANQAMAQTWGEYQAERRQIIERTNRQMRNNAYVGQVIHDSLNQLQNHYRQQSGWQNNGYRSGYQQFNSGYNRPQSNYYYYNAQPNTVYWKQQSWGQPQVYYRSW